MLNVIVLVVVVVVAVVVVVSSPSFSSFPAAFDDDNVREGDDDDDDEEVEEVEEVEVEPSASCVGRRKEGSMVRRGMFATSSRMWHFGRTKGRKPECVSFATLLNSSIIARGEDLFVHPKSSPGAVFELSRCTTPVGILIFILVQRPGFSRAATTTTATATTTAKRTATRTKEEEVMLLLVRVRKAAASELGRCPSVFALSF